MSIVRQNFSDISEIYFTALLASMTSLPVCQVRVPKSRLNDRKHRCARRWTHPILPTCGGREESDPNLPTVRFTTITAMRIGPRAARNS